VQRHLKIEGPLAFIHVSLLDNRSEFLATSAWSGFDAKRTQYVIEVSDAVAVANSIAYLSELLDQ